MDPKSVLDETNMINETILATPLPRASSTVARPASFGNLEERRQALENSESSFLDENSSKQQSIDSSLGILGNISALLSNSSIVEDKARQHIAQKIDTERELARRLLLRCSDIRESSLYLERDKENNGNVQNLTYDHPNSVAMNQSIQDRSGNFDSMRKIPESNCNESAGISVSFKPNEISARSSALSSSFQKNFSTASMPAQEGIQFDTSAAAELMAQFGDEDFQSGSRVGSRLLADEISWQQNYPYAMPTNVSPNSGKEHLELSCFSGIMGDVDVSLASENGRKLSFGQFFQRKCGNIGQLEETDTLKRPSFGLMITSPKRQGKNVALVDDTLLSEASSGKGPVVSETPNHTKQHSLMSLSSIAQALSDFENGSPRRLVDELILAKKRFKPVKSQVENNVYHPYQTTRHSAGSSFNIREKPERDMALSRAVSMLETPKYSLDGHTMPEIGKNKLKSTRLSFNFESQKPVEEINRTAADVFEKERDSRARTSLNNISSNETSNHTKISKDSAVDCSIGTRNASSSKNSTLLHESRVKLSPNSPGDNYSDARLSRTFFKKSPTSPLPPEKQSVSPLDLPSYVKEVKRETNNTSLEILQSNLKHVAKNNSNERKSSSSDVDDRDKMQEAKNSSWSSVDLPTNHRKIKPQENVISTRNTNELFCCVVGVPREAEVEIANRSDRWMTCILSLQQVQGDEANLFLDLPESRILVGPDRGKLIKINVTIRRMGNPLIAVIRIAVTDMVTKSNSSTQHLMCFVPEEPQIGITTPSGLDTLDFQSVAETHCMTLPVTLENMNNANLPLKLNIFQKSGDPQLFSVILPVHDTPDDDEFLLLKSHEQLTFDVQFKGTSLSNLKTANGFYRAVAKLLVQLRTSENNEQVMNGISLVGCIRAAKVELVDTSLPIIVGKSKTKPIRLANVGEVAVAVSAVLVENKYVNGHVDDFLLEPNELFLQPGENGIVQISHRPYEQDTTARQVFVKIVAGDSDYYYPVVRENNNNSGTNAKSSAKNSQRCVTPASRKISAPSSPVSTTSNGSGNSGRNSPLSAASTSTVADDSISIQATHSALMWCSIKTGKNEVKEFSVRNKSDNKIRLQVNIVANNKSFKFVKDRNTVGSSMLLVLQKKGSKSLSVIFEPRSVGACAGQIQFSHYSVDKEPGPPPKKIFLFGYGGVGRVDISQVFKDTGSLRWLSLGRMNSSGTLSAKFKLRNTGDLRSFARIKLTPKALYPSMINSWHIEPTELVLGPGEVQWVKLEFNPRCQDRAFRKDISHVGTVTITHGDEPTRLRIRRLYNKMKATGQLKGCENDDFRNVVFPLCKAFPGETLLKDLSLINDKVPYIGDLCRGVSQTQIMLTMEVDHDESMTVLDDEVNDTQMFYSVCSDSSSMCVAGCDSYMPTETTMDNRYQGESYGGNFTVTPSSVTLAPPYRTEATITVSSCCGVAQPFETFISHTDNLLVVPTQGMIPAGRNFPLKVQCNDTINHNIEAVLQIFMENDKREVLIKVSCKP